MSSILRHSIVYTPCTPSGAKQGGEDGRGPRHGTGYIPDATEASLAACLLSDGGGGSNFC
eukprot:1182817-Prorocentrum_minimum.AAC.5